MKVCVPVQVLLPAVVIPLDGVAHVKTPVPSVASTCPESPSLTGIVSV
ncbi:MAG: hypothetical protein IPI17_02265 [Nitrosomonas sp.]|nr:hypothetical protein [Nitrosomonas sp.]